MNERQSRLLAAIIEEFITTAMPVGSKKLLEAGSFDVSSATIRSEMGLLEGEGFLEQPHVSAGRIPTAKGYRTYVREFMKPTAHERAVRRKFDALRELYFQHKDQERAYEAVAILSRMIPNVAFASVPHKHRVYYLGLANILRQPEFQANPMLASGVIEVLETRLADFLEGVDVDDRVRFYIGEEHFLSELQSCSLIVRSYRVRDQRGAIGILGPMRMDYAYNTVVLDMAAGLLQSD